MNLNNLQSKLIVTARNNPPSDRVPYAFEKRIMARLNQPVNVWALWGQPLWRAAFSCMAIAVLCGVWSFAVMSNNDSPETFSQSFENAVYASLNQHVEDAR